MVGGKTRQLVAAPVMAPALLGWIVFAADLGQPEMQSLKKLSAIPLDASVLVGVAGQWRDATGGRPIDGAFLAIEQHSRSSAVFDIEVDGESAIALAKPLPTLVGDRDAVLLLAYPRSEALATARRLQAALAVMDILFPEQVAIEPYQPLIFEMGEIEARGLGAVRRPGKEIAVGK